MDPLDLLFPAEESPSILAGLIKQADAAMLDLQISGRPPRFQGQSIRDQRHFDDIIASFGSVPADGVPGNHVVAELVRAFGPGGVNWRSPRHFYNVGSPVNVVSSAVSAIFSDLNFFNIDDLHAGNAVVAETCVLRCLAELSGIDGDAIGGLFTFGGTATNLYAIKMAIRKHSPETSTSGVKPGTKIFITEASHYSHALAADWLGLGTDAVVRMPADPSGRTDVEAASRLLEKHLALGHNVVAVLLNGGTTYEHIIDDIPGIRDSLRRIADAYAVRPPTVHVDAVIGWGWLWFSKYDFHENHLGLSDSAKVAIKSQLERIAGITAADSWGVDFHKGIGGCAVSSSLFVVNDRQNLAYLAKDANPLTNDHHVGRHLAKFAPTQYTLETSRSSAAAVSALAGMRSIGVKGFQHWLGRLVEASLLLRRLLRNSSHFDVHGGEDGFVSIATAIVPISALLVADADAANNYNDELVKRFMSEDSRFLIASTKSFLPPGSSKRMVALKFYPTSPLLKEEDIRSLVETIVRIKLSLDVEWCRRYAAMTANA